MQSRRPILGLLAVVKVMQLFEKLPRRTDLSDFISRTHSTSPKWPVLCRMGRKTLTQSISPSVTHIQLWQVILQSVQGFWYRIRSKITFSYWLQVSPLTQWWGPWGTALPVIVSVVDTSVHWITIWSRFLLRIQLLTVCSLLFVTLCAEQFINYCLHSVQYAVE